MTQTKRELPPIIARCAAEAGGLLKLADGLKIKHQSLYSWDRVPADRLIAVEALTGIPREELRPDLFRPRVDEAAA